MSLNMSRDPSPFSRKELVITATVAVGTAALAAILSQFSLPPAILLGTVSFYAFYLLFCDLIVIYKEVPHSSYSQAKESQKDKINSVLPFLFVGLPVFLCLLVIIICL